MATTIMELLSGILNPNPGSSVGGLLSQGTYLGQTGLGPQELQRYHAMSGLGGGAPAAPPPPPQGAPSDAIAPQQAPQPQGAPAAPSGGGIGGLLSGLFGGGASSGKNETIQWLQQQGMDPGTATLMAGNKQALQQYLLKRSQGADPSDLLARERFEWEKSNQGRRTTTIDGKLVDTDSGQVIADYGGGDKVNLMSPQEVEAAGLPPGVYQRSADGKIDAVGSVRDQDAGFKNEMELRKEYDMLPEVKDYKIVRSNYERIRQGVQLGTGAGDAAIVFGYMKMLDPTSVVREGEQATTRNAAGVPEAVRGMYNQLVGGGQLSAEARQQILGAAEKVYGESSANIEDVNKRYGGYAETWKLDPSRITAPTEQYGPLAPPTVPGGDLSTMPAPEGIDPKVWEHVPPERRKLWQ